MTNELLTIEEKAANFHQMKHMERLRDLLNICIIDLLKRGERHDQSKLLPPEVAVFTEFQPKLATCTFGSPEYNANLVEMKPALDHHYANNSHHPQFWKNGVNDMDLLDIMEMLCDWKASSELHVDGNIRKSIEKNCERFGIGSQLTKILENTADILFSQ